MFDLEKPFALIVDDDDDSLLLISAILEQCGFRTAIARDFDQAKLLLNEAPMLVLLDLVMPNADSERMVEEIARQKSQVSVILMSAAAPESLESRRTDARAMGVNATATLVKPFWLDELLQVLEQALPDLALVSE